MRLCGRARRTDVLWHERFHDHFESLWSSIKEVPSFGFYRKRLLRREGRSISFVQSTYFSTYSPLLIVAKALGTYCRAYMYIRKEIIL
jgi:hypothetical protein